MMRYSLAPPQATPLSLSNRGLMAWLHSRQKLSPDKIFCIHGYLTPRPPQNRRSHVSYCAFVLAGLARKQHPSTTGQATTETKQRFMQPRAYRAAKRREDM